MLSPQMKTGLYPSRKITAEGTGYAAVTVTTEAGQKRASAFVTVNFKITDDTVVPVSGVELDQAELVFEVTRTLEGDRRNPSESNSVTPSKRLYETVFIRTVHQEFYRGCNRSDERF